MCWPPGYETDDTLDSARNPLSSSGFKPKKLRIKSGQQLFDFWNLVERGLFADCGKFLRAHEFCQVETGDVGFDRYLRSLHTDGIEVVVLHLQAA